MNKKIWKDHPFKKMKKSRVFKNRHFKKGLFSAMVAIIMLLAILFFIRNEFAQLFEVFRLDLLLVVMGIVVASGLVICVASTYFVVNKLVSLKKDELYF